MDFIDDSDAQVQYNPPVPSSFRDPNPAYWLHNKWTLIPLSGPNQTITVSFTNVTRAQVWGNGLVITLDGRPATRVPIDVNIGRFTVRDLDPSVQYTMVMEVGNGITNYSFDYIILERPGGVPATPFLPDADGLAMVDDSHPAITYYPDKTLDDSSLMGWQAMGGWESFYRTTSHFTSYSQSTLQFTFNGTFVEMWGSEIVGKSPVCVLPECHDCQGCTFILDGVAQKRPFTGNVTANHISSRLWSSLSLSPGMHNLTVGLDLEAEQDTCYCQLDYFRIRPLPGQPVPSPSPSAPSSPSLSGLPSSSVPSSATATSSSSSPSKTKLIGAVAGVVGAIVVIGVLVLFYIYRVRRRRLREPVELVPDNSNPVQIQEGVVPWATVSPDAAPQLEFAKAPWSPTPSMPFNREKIISVASTTDSDIFSLETDPRTSTDFAPRTSFSVPESSTRLSYPTITTPGPASARILLPDVKEPSEPLGAPANAGDQSTSRNDASASAPAPQSSFVPGTPAVTQSPPRTPAASRTGVHQAQVLQDQDAGPLVEIVPPAYNPAWSDSRTHLPTS